ncbi:hypothetical protein AB0478_46715 [Streptomyces sp. NPDC051917]|uniref:hypothetical protein n=1 Tax=Streptomyces sp. NPDC051917 TaxID=3154754 RepID=UPI003452D321
MILLLPVSRFGVTYEVGSGRPYSRLEELLCRMIADAGQPVTLAHLREAFQVHDRLLIEGVVTLVRAGWAAMNLGEGIVITEQGKQTLNAGGRPQGTVIRRARTSIYMERVCGLLERETQSGLNVRTRRDLLQVMSPADWDRSLLAVRNPRNSLSIGQAQGLLSHRAGEWIRWVAEPRMQTKANEFVPVHVDLASRTVTGLPRSWDPMLSEVLLREAQERSEEGAELSPHEVSRLVSQPTGNRPSRDGFTRTAMLPLRHDSAALVHDEDEFLGAAARIVEEAHTSVLITVPQIDAEAVRSWEPRLKDTLSRGVRIDVLWGAAVEGQEGDGAAELKRIAAQTARGSVRSLRFNTRPAGTVSSLVVADRQQGGGTSTGTAVVGGLPLLCESARSTRVLPALVVSDAGVVAQIARAAAGWWAETAGEEFSAATDRWRRLASGWDQSARTVDGRPAAFPTPQPTGSQDRPRETDTATVLVDADCALLEIAARTEGADRAGAVDGVIVRAYGREAVNSGRPALRGAVAVHLQGPSWEGPSSLVTEAIVGGA